MEKPASKLDGIRALGAGQIARRYAGAASSTAPERGCEACKALRARIVDLEAKLAAALAVTLQSKALASVTLQCAACDERKARQRARVARHRRQVE